MLRTAHSGKAQKRHDTRHDALADTQSQIANGIARLARTVTCHLPSAIRNMRFAIRYLLKTLSRITEPTKGRALIDGRVGSLLEACPERSRRISTGFHPELTGRNAAHIYLNGATLRVGMKKAEITRKFDETCPERSRRIVAFAEIEKFLDTPVKHYSTGMYVRLAFAVAAHLAYNGPAHSCSTM